MHIERKTEFWYQIYLAALVDNTVNARRGEIRRPKKGVYAAPEKGRTARAYNYTLL